MPQNNKIRTMVKQTPLDTPIVLDIPAWAIPANKILIINIPPSAFEIPLEGNITKIELHGEATMTKNTALTINEDISPFELAQSGKISYVHPDQKPFKTISLKAYSTNQMWNAKKITIKSLQLDIQYDVPEETNETKIFLGNKKITAIYHQGKMIKKIYLGDKLIE